MRILVPGICAIIWMIALVPLSRGATAILPAQEENVMVADTLYSYGNNKLKPFICVGIEVRTTANAVFTLMRFDLKTLPKTAKISKACLVLKTIQSYPRLVGNYALWVEQISVANADWIQGKGTSTTDCNPEDCYETSVGLYRKLLSYQHSGRHTGEPWASGPGGFGREGDIAFLDGKHPVNDLLSEGRIWRVAMKPGTVQGWLTNASLASAGLALSVEGPKPTKNFWIQFYSRDYEDPESVPHIEVEYTQ